MLSQMRQHSQSWILKVFLAVIVLSFIFFWGTQDPGRGNSDSRTYAFVNGSPITAQQVEYKLSVSPQLQQWESQMGGKVPPFIIDSLRRNIVEGFVTQKLTLKWLNSLGIIVSKMELMDEIKKTPIPELHEDGEFDYKKYVKFNNRYAEAVGVSYEQSLKEDLLVDKIVEPLREVFKPAEGEIKSHLALKNKLRKFAVIKVRKDPPPPEDESKSKDKPETAKPNEGYGEELAQTLLKLWQKKADMKKVLDENGLKIHETEDVDVFGLPQVVDGQRDIAAIKMIHALGKNKPVINEPLLLGQYYYLIKWLDESDATGTEREVPRFRAENDLMAPAFGSLNALFIDGLRKSASLSYDLPRSDNPSP